MHTDPNQYKNRKQTKIDDKMGMSFQNSAKQFDKKIQEMQRQFTYSKDTIYYIVSVNFIKEWKQFCMSSQTQRLLPHDMNYDLYEDGEFKNGLVEKADYQIVNQQIYQLFKPFKDQKGLNRRQSIVIGHEKRVPIYLPSFKYILTTLEILKSIDFNRKDQSDFQLSIVKSSQQSTLKNFIQTIKQKENLSDIYQARLWISQKQLTVKKLFKLIKDQLKPCSLATYKVQGVGKRIQDLDAKISDLMLDQEAYFILQLKKSDEKFVFIKQGQGRCESCNHFGNLQFPCGCNKVKYCSEECLQKDKVYHMRHCTYAQQMQLNKKVIMTVSTKNNHGLVGLKNLGNTCFMNSCLQCLSNTMPLTKYFLGQYFQSQINKVNPIGTKGKLAKNYAKFIKAMWCDQEDTFSPYSVKNAVSTINPMFQGYAQHDSQQFFSFLVDGLHEDLNRILNKPIVNSVEQGTKNQDQFAMQSWKAHLRRNQSVITDTMTGQYRSIVICPDCQHKSTTFDPFITVSLPIPESNQSILQFFLIHANMQKKNKRAWVKYSKKDPDQWHKKACDVVGAHIQKCNLYVVSLKQNIYKIGRESMTQIVHKIQNQSKNVFLMEFTEQQIAIPKQYALELTLRISKTSYGGQSDELFFKIPILIDSRNANGLTIYKKVLKFLYSQAYDSSKNKKTFGWGGKSYEEYEKQFLSQRSFKLLLRTGKKIQRTYTRIEIEFKNEKQIKDDDHIRDLFQRQGLKVGECQVDARFQKGKTSEFSFDKLKDFDTIGRPPKTDKSQVQVQLNQCLQTFKTPEILEAGNQWYCPKCKQHKLAKKQLGIYRAPQVLILHLKRFKQKGSYRKQKNQSLVKFPSELDMSPYLINMRPMEAYKQQIQQNVYQRPKAEGLQFIRFQTKSKPIYDLYAISNHYGGLGGGHYTAYCKNNGQWYSFDDSHVSKTGKKDIISSSAYLLFYERRQ